MEFNIEKYYFNSCDFFEFFSPEEIQLIKKKIARKEFIKGDYLFKEGTTAKGIYILTKGKVKLVQVNRDGKESIIYIYAKGDFFGYRLLLSDEPMLVSAIAMENVTTSFISARFFFDLLDSSSLFSKKLLAHLAKEFLIWINKVTVFSQYGVRDRVAMTLLILEKIYHQGEDQGGAYTISINRDDLAAYVGTAKETLVRMLRLFKDEDIIRTKGTKIIVQKKEVLLNMVSEI